MKLQDVSNANDVKVTDALSRIRKGSSVAPKQIALAAAMLGWEIVEKMDVYQHKYLNHSAKMNEFLGAQHASFYVGESDTDPIIYRIECKTQEIADDIHSKFEKFVVRNLPEKISKKDTMFVLDLTDVEKTTHDFAPYEFSCQIWFATKTINFTSTDGKSGRMVTPINSNGYDTYKFQATDLYKQLKAEVIDFLGLGTVEQEREKKQRIVKLERLGENSGHCAICGGLQKLRKTNGKLVMVHHGYQRPGHGYIVGDCFGVNYQPYEKSAEACEKYIPALEHIKNRYQLQLNMLKSGETRWLIITRKREQVKITPDDDEWDKNIKLNIANFESQIRYISQDIEMFEKRVTEWKEKPLPYEELTK